MLKGSRITVGVAGGIAAYKAADLVSRLVKAGASVSVVMTEAARQFVNPLTFETLSGHTVYTDAFAPGPEGRVVHIELAQACDLLVIAPATANILGKVASGIADNLLSTTVLAAAAPVIFAPAMNTVMYQNKVVQRNIVLLKELGYHFVAAESGRLACGAVGPGRMAEPPVIVEEMIKLLTPQDMAGLSVLITAGPTREPIDPVRYISNRSSGKMGYALARAARNRGARVILISGPTALAAPLGVTAVPVETAAEMRRQVLNYFPDVDVVVKAAAVSDYRPAAIAPEKIKKTADAISLDLVKNPDILAELGQIRDQQILVGFAAETKDLESYARDKLTRKNLHLIVANDVSLPGAGFDANTNIAKLFYAHGEVTELPLMDKLALAHRIWDGVLKLRRPL